MTKGLTTAVFIAVVGGLLLGVTITTAPASASVGGQICFSQQDRDSGSTIVACQFKPDNNAQENKADCKATDNKCSSSQTGFGVYDRIKPPKP